MSKVTGLATAGVQVTDLKEAIHFYETLLGFEKKSDPDQKGIWGTIGDLRLYVEGAGQRKELKLTDTRITLVLATDDVADLYRRTQEMGVALDEDLQPLVDGKTFWFRFRDPSGNIFEAAGPKLS